MRAGSPLDHVHMSPNDREVARAHLQAAQVVVDLLVASEMGVRAAPALVERAARVLVRRLRVLIAGPERR